MRPQLATDRPTVVGTGLISLDVIVDEAANTANAHAGGTCGNVLTILGYLGWRSIPLARLTKDTACSLVQSDLNRWGIETDYLSLGPSTPTPVIVELLNNRRHRFLLACPSCGAYLPSHRPITLDMARALETELHAPTVFFFDRVSPAAIYLAEQAQKSGTLVVFEPASIGDLGLLRRALAVTDILKVSADRNLHAAFDAAPESPMVIETCGESGLRYRTGGRRWRNLGAFPTIGAVLDTAGAGDWCTAGILFRLESMGVRREDLSNHAALYDAISFGQALGAWTCGFVGPRGGMYEKTLPEFWRAIRKLLKGRIPRVTFPTPHDSDTTETVEPVCAQCDIEFAAAVRDRHRASS